MKTILHETENIYHFDLFYGLSLSHIDFLKLFAIPFVTVPFYQSVSICFDLAPMNNTGDKRDCTSCGWKAGENRS